MTMNRSTPIPQSYLFVARIGDDGVTESSPPAHDSAAWMKLGNQPTGALSVEIEWATRFEIVLGQRVRVQKERARYFTQKSTIEELNKQVIDLIFRSNTTSDDDFISQGSQSVRCWVRMQAYDETDSNIVLLQGKGPLSPTGDIPLGGEDFFRVEFECPFEGKVSGKLLNAFSS